MIDIENEIIDALITAIHTVDSTALVCSEAYLYETGDDTFPCVTVREVSNVTYKGSLTQALSENHVVVAYDVNVYSNKSSGRKEECKKLLKSVDNYLIGHNFKRLSTGDLSYLCNSSVTRFVARYEAIVGSDGTIYRS